VPHRSGETPTSILFVCTGNTCRSPMAEGILRRRLRERGVEGVTVESAGTFALDGCPASDLAVEVCRKHGIDLADHRARLLTPEIVGGTGLILGMEAGHRMRAIELGGAGRAHLLTAFAVGTVDGSDRAEGIPDPAGGERSWYEGVYDRLEREVERIAAYLTDAEDETE